MNFLGGGVYVRLLRGGSVPGGGPSRATTVVLLMAHGNAPKGRV